MFGDRTLAQVSEGRMQLIRGLLTVGWLVMIASLFWDPISPYLTDPQRLTSPFRLDPDQCIDVQGECLVQEPYSLAMLVFWTLVVPGSILVLLVFGHETWRRICPLSLLSQIPRSLGIQRKRKVTSKAGATRYELVKIRKESWLGKHHLYVQFALLTAGLAARLLLLNSNPLALGMFLVLTIAGAIAVGYLYEGKSWCQYFCPMAPVQLVFTGPRGLLGSEAHQGQRQSVTQSMCRTVDKEGNVKSACVGCQSPCIDIDAERTYWETFNKPGRRFVQYGYVGLLLSFFIYAFLYAGNFDYLFSGAWLREANVAGTLFHPGFYLAGQTLPIPRLVAVPLTLVLGSGLGYGVLNSLEKLYRNMRHRQQKTISQQQATHTIFAISTFLAFNLFFFFSSRSVLRGQPIAIHLLFNGLLVLVSTLWLARTLSRSAELYSRESLANSLRRQLSKLAIDFSRFLEGRSMDDLKAEEVYVLAKVLPGFNQEQSLQVYKGVLRETLEQGNADSASSLDVLRPLRQELNIKDDDHFAVLTELGSVEPELLDPRKRRTRESQLRLDSYRQALASMLLDLVDSGMSLQDAMQRQKKQIQFLKLEYGMTAEEEDAVLNQLLAGEKSTILRKTETLLEQMQHLGQRYQVLHNSSLDTQTPVFKFLRLVAVQHKQEILIRQLLGLLEMLGDSPEAVDLARSIQAIASDLLQALLQTAEGASTPWSARLKPAVMAVLKEHTHAGRVLEDALPHGEGNGQTHAEVAEAPPTSTQSLGNVLTELLADLDPLIQTLALYSLNVVVPRQARQQAKQLLASDQQNHWLVRETAQTLLDREENRVEEQVQTLIAELFLTDRTETCMFQQPVVRVGSGRSNDIVIPDRHVAANHAVFYLDQDGFNVLDLGTAKGLYVGSQYLHNESDRLAQGQVIRFTEANKPAIALYWEKQPRQNQMPAETMGTLDKVLLLFESRFFRSLKPDALIELGRNATLKNHPRGAHICHAGDPSDSILLLVDGVAEVMVRRGNSEQLVGMVNAGETIGEMGVLTRQRRSASVVAASDYCRVLIIQADTFDAVLYQDPEIARNLLVVLSSRLQSMTSTMTATPHSAAIAQS